jgi:predicted phosphodiesterase
MDEILKRSKDESFRSYLIRLFSNKHAYGLNPDSITNLLNKEYGSDFGESKWRKMYASYTDWKDFIISENLDQEIIDKYETIKLEAEKEKIRKQDQKNAYRKLVRNQSRFEDIKDDISIAIKQLAKEKPLILSPSLPHFEEFDPNRQGLALFSDWHLGADIHNSINIYNKDEFNKRVKILIEKLIRYGIRNNISTLNIGAIGDFLNGLIHVSTRVQSREDIIEQITYVSEILSDIIFQLSTIFPKINAYFVNGNHARPSGNKDDFGLNENFERLLPWYIQARLQNAKNVNIVTEQDGYIVTNIFDKSIILVHGQYDNPNNSVYNLSQMLNIVPDYLCSGHIHHNFEKEFNHTKAIVNSSLIGADDYSVAKRLTTRPSQKFMVFDKDEGLECTYEIYVA